MSTEPNYWNTGSDVEIGECLAASFHQETTYLAANINALRPQDRMMVLQDIKKIQDGMEK